MVKAKITDYGILNYGQLLDYAILSIPDISSGAAFKAQMQRFIKKSTHDNAFGKPGFDTYLGNAVNKLFKEVKDTVAA